jgi:serine/threonine protein kinase
VCSDVVCAGTQVIQHIAKRLQSLHAAGYAHRDLKPGNVMWLPRENRWTVIDFGCAARIGTTARLGFSIAYAAPEVIAAFRNHQRTMYISGAIDAWALGVLAFELFSGQPVVSKPQTRDEVRAHFMPHARAPISCLMHACAWHAARPCSHCSCMMGRAPPRLLCMHGMWSAHSIES